MSLTVKGLKTRQLHHYTMVAESPTKRSNQWHHRIKDIEATPTILTTPDDLLSDIANEIREAQAKWYWRSGREAKGVKPNGWHYSADPEKDSNKAELIPLDNPRSIQTAIWQSATSISPILGLPKKPLAGILAKFSLSAGRQDWHDLLHEVIANLLEIKRPTTLKVAYGIARSVCVNFLRKKRREQTRFASIDIDTTFDEDGNGIGLTDTLVGEAQFELFIQAKIETKRLLKRLPKTIQVLLLRKLNTGRLPREEAHYLAKWIRLHPEKLKPIRAELTKASA